MIHLEKEYIESEGDDPDYVTAVCGAKATIQPNGDIEPPDYDFVVRPGDGIVGGVDQVTCPGCRPS